MPFAGELGALVERLGYSLERLARESGVSKATLHRWVSGKVARPYYWENLLAVAQVLNLNKVDVNRLLLSSRLPPVDALAAGARPEQQELFTRWTTPTRNNLPSGLTSFVGREEETLEIAELLNHDDVRLVTLTGPGGAGKTRLALRVADELHDVFPDGIFFVALAPVTDPELVLPAIAQSLELRDVAAQPAEERLLRYLRERRVLLVLDNFEQVVDAAPEVVSLLRNTRHVRALVTSRVALRVSAEHERPVALLELPQAGANLATLSASPAVTLFADRARAVRPDFAVTRGNASSVVEVCQRLDGSPLGIELAAARCRQFSPRELLERFPSRLDLGADGPRDLEQRQRSLRDAIDWSYDLLSTDAQTLFRRLAVFAGGWTEESAAEVCAVGLAAMPELVEANLVQQVAPGRYAMVETIREYALERLAQSGEEEAVRDGHAAYFLRIAGSREPYVPQVRQPEWLGRIDLELGNVRAALSWVLDRGDHELAARLAGTLWPYWHEHGHGQFSEGLRWLKLAEAGLDGVSPLWRASVLTGVFVLTYSLGDMPEAARYGERSLRLWRELGNGRGAALTLNYLGMLRFAAGDIPGALAFYGESRAEWQSIDMPLGVALAESHIAVTLITTGQFEAAEEPALSAHQTYEREGNVSGLTRSYLDRGLAAMLQGDVFAAIPLLQHGVELSRQLGDNPHLPWGLFYLGTSLSFAGELERAALALQESLDILHAAGERYGMSYTLLGCAALALRQGRAAAAATLCGAVDALLESAGVVMNPAVQAIYARESQAVREQLGDDAFEHAYTAGRDMSPDEAAAFAARMNG